MLRSLTQNLRLFTNINFTRTALSRTMFTDSAIGIENFKAEQIKVEKLVGREMAITSFVEGLNAKKIVSQNLQEMIYSACTDQDIALLIRGLKEYKSTDEEPFSNNNPFGIGVALMRLLYIHNKPDLALELLLDEQLRFLLRPNACTVLATKLYNEGRYDDVIRIMDHVWDKKYYLEPGASPYRSTQVSTDLKVLAFASLGRLGDTGALQKMKYYVKKGESVNEVFPLNSLGHSIFVALKHNDIAFAQHLLSKFILSDAWTTVSLKLLVLSHANINEAVDLLDKSRTVQFRDKNLIIYRSILNEMGKFVEKANDPALLKRFQNLVKVFEARDSVNNSEFIDTFFAPRRITFVNKGRLTRETQKSQKRHAPGQLDDMTGRFYE